jgi:hypothetical protein
VPAFFLVDPVRITSYLFNDGSHPKPCFNGQRQPGQPGRVSSWKIHPIYGIDVCRKKSLSNCKPWRESDWMTLEQWLEENAEDEDDPEG